MKEYWKMLKRGLAMLLAVVMVLTSSNLGVVLRAAATETETGPSKELSDIVVELYKDKLSENLIEIIKTGELAVEKTYTYDKPTDSDLITIDEEERTITAKAYTDESGNVWTPVRYRLVAKDLADPVRGAIEADKAVAYYYTGNAFEVEVDYETTLELDEDLQNELLTSASKLAEDIAKLMLTGEDIIPDLKPEGWDNWSEQKKQAYKDYELIVKYDELQEYIDGMLEKMDLSSMTLTPLTVAQFMTMPVLSYDDETGLSAIDLLYKLGYEGMEQSVLIPAELREALVENDLNNSVDDDGNLTVEIGFANKKYKAAIENLLKQQTENDGLDLYNFLIGNAGNSYLEWLMVASIYGELVDSLTGNYDDIYLLADKGLPNIMDQLEGLMEDVETIEGVALDMISEMLPELNKTLEDNDFAPFGKDVVENKADVDALVAHIEKIKKDGQTALDALLTLLNADLTNYGYTKKVTNSAELQEAIDWVLVNFSRAQEIQNMVMEEATALMEAFDYPFEELGLSKGFRSNEDIDAAIAWLTERSGADLKAAQEKVQAQLDEANALAKSFGYTGTIASSTDVKKVATWLEAQIAADETSLQGYIDTANDALKQANAELPVDQQYKGTVKSSKDIDDVMTWMNDLVADAENILAEELEKLNKELTDAGYNGKKVETAEDIDDVIAWVDQQLLDAEAQLGEKLAELNAELKNYGYDGKAVETSKDIDNVIAWVEEQVEEAEELKAEKLAELNTELKNYGYDGKAVETSKDIDNVIAWVEGKIDEAEAKKAEELSKLNKQLADAGYTGTVKTSADMDAVIVWAQGEAAGKIADAKQQIADAQKEIDSKLTELNDGVAAYGYKETVSTVEDMDAVIAYMQNDAEAYVWAQVNAELPAPYNNIADVNVAKTYKATMEKFGMTEDAARLGDAIEAVEMIPSLVEDITAGKQTLADALAKIADAEKQLADAEAEVADKIAELEDAKKDLASVEKQLDDAKAEVDKKVAELEDGKEELAKAEADLKDAKDEVASKIADLEEGKVQLADAEQKIADAKKEVDEKKAELKEGQEQLANAEAQIDEAQEMADQYNKTLDSAKKSMKSLEDKIASKKANLPTQKAKLTTAETNLKKAEDGLTNLDNDEARAITELRTMQSRYDSATADFVESREQYGALVEWKTDITTVEDAMAELNDGLEKMGEVQTALGEVEENKATLVETIDMLDILITMLELFCQKIEPIYNSAKANDWNVRSVLKAYSATADYDKLTEWATGETAPKVTVVESYKLPEVTVSNSLAMWNVTLVVKGWVLDENGVRKDLKEYSEVVTLVDGATAEEIVAAADELGLQDKALEFWGLTEEKANVQFEGTTFGETVPETLVEDITLTYRDVFPAIRVITFGDGFENGTDGLENMYSHGSVVILPVHEDENLEWEYTVNGEKHRQGTTVKITANTEISRKEGAASEKVALTELVIGTTAGMSENAKNILRNGALKLTDVVYVRLPGDDLVVVTRENGETIVKAPNYDSNVAGDWVASTGVMDGTLVYFTDGVYTTNEVFKEIVVKYQLGVSAADLGVSSEKLNDYVNAGYVLASDYNFQKNTLDTLIWALSTNDRASGEVANLEGLAMLDRGYQIEMNGLKLTLGSALVDPDYNANLIGGMFGLSEGAIKALANVLRELKVILPDNGPHPLYSTLKAYAESKNGMLHYYQNEQTYIDQLNELYAIMATLPMDELAALPATFYNLFNTIQVALSDAAALGETENRIRTDLIDLKSGYLNALLIELAKYDLNEQYSVSGDLNWIVEITAGGPDSVKYTVTVSVEGTGSDTQNFTKNMDEGFDADAEAAAILEAKGWSVDGKFYELTKTQDGNTYTYSYTYKNYNVEIPGGETAVLNLNNQTIILPGHTNPAFAYDYNVAGEVVRVFGDDFAKTLSPAQFDALTIGGVKITVEEVNVAEDKLVELVEGTMGGTLVKNEEGKYAAVLGIDVGNTNSLIGMVMGLYMSGYETVELGGKTLVANNQFHLQTLVDALLYSGISTMDLNKNIAADGTITNTLVIGGKQRAVSTTVEGNHYTLIQSTLTFGDQEPMDVYFTLTGNGAAFKNILNTISGYGVDVQLDNGSANLAITIPEPFYTAYLATLSMVGEVDLRNVNEVNAEIALGYFTKMITDIMNTEGVSIDTFGKTIGVDLSAYESYYDMAKDLMNLVKFGEDGCTITLDLPIIPIKSVIDSLEGSIELPIEGVSLGGMIYEYEIGLKLGVGAKINNFANDYDVLFVDVKGNGLANKVGMKALDETGKLDLATTSVVILLNDIENLYITDTMTLVDLNGFDVKGTITGGPSADVIVVDSNYEAEEGVVGNVSGNVTLLAGKYLNDVSAYVNDGYMQDGRGVVCNRLFTVSETDDVITVTLNATAADAKTLLTQEGVFGLAAEILFDQFINHYNVAGVSMDGNMIYNINFEDILGIVSGGTGAILDTALAFVDEAQLSAVFNALVADLTDFKNIGEALGDYGSGVIASHEFTTTTWGLDLDHNADDDTLSVNFGGSYGKTETKTLQLEIEGESRGAMAILATALGNVLDVDLRVELEDIYRNDAGQFNVKGDFTGSVVFDFTVGDYGVMMALVLANGADEDLKADLVEAIEYYYATTDSAKLREVFNNLTVEDVCSALANGHNSTTTISEIVENLGLTCADKVLANVDGEMGFDLVIDALAYGLRLLDSHGIGESITDSGFKLGRLETSDDKGYYYGRSGSKGISGTNTYLDYALNAETIELKIYLFGEHVCKFDQKRVAPEYLMAEATYDEAAKYYYSCICGKSSKGITDEWFYDGDRLVKAPTIEIDAGKIEIGGKLYGVKYDEAKGYLILDTIADGMTEAEILAVLTQGSEVENDKDNKAEKVTSNVVGKNGLVGTGSTFTLQAKNSVGDTDEVTVTIIILGDVDCDGSLSANDAVKMRLFALYRQGYELNEVQKVAANANGLASNFSREGVDSGDAVVVKLKWLGKYGTVLPPYESPLA